MALYNLGGMRKPYNKDKIFSMDHLVAREPYGQFAAWFDEACNCKDIIEPNAMCIATSTKSGVPSARIVLLKGYSKEGFTFFTRYTSRKGEELTENPLASLCFYWEPLKKSIRIDGIVKKIPEKDSADYFATRPRPSRIAAVVSCSLPKVIESRKDITDKLGEVDKNFEGKDIPKPKDWGGYIIVPHQIEFWDGQTDRTHDRIVFRKSENEDIDDKLTKKGEDGWLIERFAP